MWGLTAAQSDQALVRYCQSQSYCHTETEVKGHVQATLVSCAWLELHSPYGNDTLEGPRLVANQHRCEPQYPDFAAKQRAASKKRCTKKQQRPAAWTTSPLTEGEAVQSAHLCVQSNNLQWLTHH